jgi:hypothetical protein
MFKRSYMEITRIAKISSNMANITVWHCGGCGVVHMSVGKMVLDFTREEFANFTESVVDVNYSGWAPVSREHSILDLASVENLEARGSVH